MYVNVKQCTEAPSDIKHASVKARVYVRAKAKRIKALNALLMLKKEEKSAFKAQLNIAVSMKLHGTTILYHFLLPSKTFTLLEDHYFQERFERYQTPFTVYQLNKMYTGTFTFMPADKNWIYDLTQNPYHNCPAHHQFEVNLVSWRLEISEVELTYDGTANVMIMSC